MSNGNNREYDDEYLSDESSFIIDKIRELRLSTKGQKKEQCL